MTIISSAWGKNECGVQRRRANAALTSSGSSVSRVHLASTISVALGCHETEGRHALPTAGGVTSWMYTFPEHLRKSFASSQTSSC